MSSSKPIERPVFAFAVDAVPPALLEAWMAQGATPRIAALRAAGAYGRLGKADDHPHEASWSALLQGCEPRASGEWARHVYHPAEYRVEERAVYRLERHPPFHTFLGESPAVVFDVPHVAILPRLRGVQVLGWGLEENTFMCSSQPRELFASLVQRHGANPFFGGAARRVLESEADGAVGGFRLPSAYDPVALQALEGQMVEAIRRRAAILVELMGLGPWRLTFAANAELHLAMHMLWRAPQTLASIAQAFDNSLDAVLQGVPPDAFVAFFSVSGMAANYTDLPTTLFLPEFLYRLQFGEAALAAGAIGSPVPPPATHYRKHWKDEIWALRTARGGRELESPDEQGAKGDPFDWAPLNWYRTLWPRMRAFALPSYSHGMVRINLRGRDSQGMVEPADYERTCDELATALRGLVNARTGNPIVKAVIRTRSSPQEDGEQVPPADLMISWKPEEPTDVVESPLVGRVGPVPWLRTGGHVPDGFALLLGPGIRPGSRIREGARITDLTATLLEMLGIAAPDYVEGRSLL